jgi:hypothetical protein
MRQIIVVFLICGLSCCSHPSDKKAQADIQDSAFRKEQIGSDTTRNNDIDYFKLDSYLVDEVSDTSKLFTIDNDCALLISPTLERIESMKKEYGEDFFTIADDATYYQGMAIGLLDSMKIKTVSTDKANVKFIGTSKSWTLNIARKGFPAWNLIFFKRSKEPKIISTVGLTTQNVKEYFEIAR